MIVTASIRRLIVTTLCAAVVSTGCSPATSSSSTLATVDDGAGIPVATVAVPGGSPAVFSAFARNTANKPTVVESVSAVGIPGDAIPMVSDVAISTGGDFVGAGNSWPPRIRTRPILDKPLPRGPVTFVVALTDTRFGRIFAISGIRVTFREGGQERVTTIATIGIGCAYTTGTMASACAKLIEKAKQHADDTVAEDKT